MKYPTFVIFFYLAICRLFADTYYVSPTGSDWMPSGLPVLTTMAESERFAKEVYSRSIIPEFKMEDLPEGRLN